MPSSRQLLLSLLLAAQGAHAAAATACAEQDALQDETCALQVRTHTAAVKAHATCSVGDDVPCDGGGRCAGNQCCPDSSVCPSASSGWNQCNEPKKSDCLATACCSAETAQCLACAAGETEAEFCAKNPGVADCPAACCKAYTSDCLACQSGMTPAEFCAKNPGVADCPSGGTPCCTANTAECLACADGKSKKEWCAVNPTVHECGIPPSCLLCGGQCGGSYPADQGYYWLSSGTETIQFKGYGSQCDGGDGNKFQIWYANSPSFYPKTCCMTR